MDGRISGLGIPLETLLTGMISRVKDSMDSETIINHGQPLLLEMLEIGTTLLLLFGTTNITGFRTSLNKIFMLRLNPSSKPKFKDPNLQTISNSPPGNPLKNYLYLRLIGQLTLQNMVLQTPKNFSFQVTVFGLLIMKMLKSLNYTLHLLEDGLVQ